MSDPIFALTRHEYKSYTDLLKLIELSSFPTCFVDEIDASSNNTYILPVRNGEVGEGWKGARAKIIHWALEWDPYPPLDGIAEVWSADKWHSQRDGSRYVPMGSHPDLCPVMTPKQDLYDVAFFGYFDGVPRRQVIRQQLIERGVKVSPTGAWGEVRHALLRNSAAFLHVHQLEHAPTIAPLRMVVAAAYALPVISETVADSGIFYRDYRSHLLYPYDILADAVKFCMHQTAPDILVTEGIALHQLLCHDLTFRKSVEAAL